jgi:hypothetical protein
VKLLATGCALGVLAFAASAAAATSPLVPAFVQHLIQKKAGSLAYVPTRAPAGYRYALYAWNPAKKQLTVRVHDRHYRLSNHNRDVTITVSRLSGSLASCANGNEKSYQVDGNKVYSAGGNVAWRCVNGPAGNVKIAASGANLPASALAIAASSVKHL